METAGDAYIVSGGVLTTDGEGYSCVDEHHDCHLSAQRVLGFAKAMLHASHQVREGVDQIAGWVPCVWNCILVSSAPSGMPRGGTSHSARLWASPLQ